MNAEIQRRSVALIGCLAVGVLAAVGCSQSKHTLGSGLARELDTLDPWTLGHEQVQALVALANQGNGKAAWTLAQHFSRVPDKRAHKYLVMAAESGIPEAQHTYYSVLIQSPDRSVRENAVVWLERAAKHGNKRAEQALEWHEEVLGTYERRYGTESKREERGSVKNGTRLRNSSVADTRRNALSVNPKIALTERHSGQSSNFDKFQPPFARLPAWFSGRLIRQPCPLARFAATFSG
jgi:hypothetical protein